MLDRYFYSPIAKKPSLNNKWQLLKEVAALFYLGSLPGVQQEPEILLKSLLTSRALVLELGAPFSAEVCVKWDIPATTWTQEGMGNLQGYFPVFHTWLGDSRQTVRGEFCHFFLLIWLVKDRRW